MPPFSLPPIFTCAPIALPVIRQPPSRPHVPFYRLVSHTRPTKWSLYRPLLKFAPDSAHREAVRSRWRRPRKRHCTSAHLTIRLLAAEEQTLVDYKRLHHALLQPEALTASNKGQVPVEPEPALLPTEDSRPSVDSLENPDCSPMAITPYHLRCTLPDSTSHRLRGVQEQLEKLQLEESMSASAVENYLTSLKQAYSYYRPIQTPGLIFPSMLNAGMPRLKPQPLHMTMLMTHRQRARDRRIVQLKSWQEMQMHMSLEEQFVVSVGLKGERNLFEYIQGTVGQMRRSDSRDLARLNTKFKTDVLAKRSLARRFRPSILTAQKRRKETTARLNRLSLASRAEAERSSRYSATAKRRTRQHVPSPPHHPSQSLV